MNRLKTKRAREISCLQLIRLAHQIGAGEIEDFVIVYKEANKPEMPSTIIAANSLGRLCGWMFGLKANGEPTKATLARWNRKAAKKSEGK